MSKEEYKKLLNRYKNIQDSGQTIEEMADNFQNGVFERDENKYIEEFLKDELLPKYDFRLFPNEFRTIMESEMFLDGQYKGVQLTGGAKIFRSYQINDLEEFIYLLCKKIHDYSPIDFDSVEYGELASIVKAIENAGSSIQRLLGKPTAKQIDTIKEKIKRCLDDNRERESSLEWPSEKKLSNDIYYLFRKHIQCDHESIISDAVSKFLGLFGIPCKPKTLTMRDYRKRKTLSRE